MTRETDSGRGTDSGRERAAKAIVTGMCVVGLACGGGKTKAPRTPPVGKILAALLAASDKATAPWRCAAADLPTLPDEELATRDAKWKLSGQSLKRVDDDNEVVIGVVADAAGSHAPTVAALGRVRAAFDAAKVDLVISLGGMGATRPELEATLGTLGDKGVWPVVALPGDLEQMTAHTGALAALRTQGGVVLDGRLVRWIELPTVTIGTLPGAGAPERLATAGDGCMWSTADSARVLDQLSAKTGVRIIATAEAPRLRVDGEPAGELALVPSTAQPIDVSLHGPVQPVASPARTGGRDGKAIPLTPGTADATSRMPRAHRPAAGLLVIRGQSWAWRPLVDAK